MSINIGRELSEAEIQMYHFAEGRMPRGRFGVGDTIEMDLIEDGTNDQKHFIAIVDWQELLPNDGCFLVCRVDDGKVKKKAEVTIYYSATEEMKMSGVKMYYDTTVEI